MNSSDSSSWSARLSTLAADLLAGFVLALFNFSGILRHAIQSFLTPESDLSKFLIRLSRIASQILPSSPDLLYRLMVMCFFGIWIYLGLVVILSASRRRLEMILVGTGGIIAGLLSLSAMTWIGRVIEALIWLVVVVFSFFEHLFQVIFAFIGHLLAYVLPVLLVAALIAGIVFLWKEYGPKTVIIGAIVAGILWLMGPLFRALWNSVLFPVLKWLAGIIGLIFSWVFSIVGFLFKWIAIIAAALMAFSFILGVLGSLGHLLIDQIRTAWHAGRSQKGVLFGSFSIGASVALILLVSAGVPARPTDVVPIATVSLQPTAPQPLATRKKGKKKLTKKRKVPAPVVVAPPPPPPEPISEAVDRAWQKAGWSIGRRQLSQMFIATLPHDVQEWAKSTFTAASAPTSDALVLAVAVFLSVISVGSGIFVRKDMEFIIRFHNRDLLALAALPVLVVAVLVASSHTNQDS